MAKYEVVVPTALVRSAPLDIETNVVGRFTRKQTFEGDVPAGDTGFIRVIEPNPPGPTAFININSVREIGAQIAPEPIEADEHDGFCRLVTRAARKHGPDRDYLMAAAYCASKNLTDIGTATSTKVGPFQISAEDWKEAVTDGVAKGMGFSLGDRYLWYRQPVVAALRAADCAKRMSAALGRDPTSPELYFAQLFGAGAEAILKGDRSRLCSAAIAGTPAAGSYAAELKASGKTVAAVLDELQDCLVKGLTEALKVIDEQPPEIRFFHPNDAEPPWLAVARDEMQRIVVEIPGDLNNDRIALYHRTAGVADTRDETPWCASFVTYCMKASGVQAVADSVPRVDSAATKAWESWGRPIADGAAAPAGAVIVLRPGGPDSGHVGFLIETTGDGFIRLLGGNQGTPNQVGIVRFPVNQIIARRWLDVGPALSAGQLTAIFPQCPDPATWASAISAAWRRFGFITKNAQAGFLGITGNETGGFVQVKRESMRYSPQRAVEVWPAKAGANTGFPTLTCREKIAAGEMAFGNWIYAGIIGNGDEASGDGFKYRGGGIIQLTGRGNYKACSDALAMPALAEDPDLLTRDPNVSAAAAAWFMVEYKKLLGLLNGASDADYLAAAGQVGLAPDGAAVQRRLEMRRKALAVL